MGRLAEIKTVEQNLPHVESTRYLFFFCFFCLRLFAIETDGSFVALNTIRIIYISAMYIFKSSIFKFSKYNIGISVGLFRVIRAKPFSLHCLSPVRSSVVS